MSNEITQEEQLDEGMEITVTVRDLATLVSMDESGERTQFVVGLIQAARERGSETATRLEESSSAAESAAESTAESAAGEAGPDRDVLFGHDLTSTGIWYVRVTHAALNQTQVYGPWHGTGRAAITAALRDAGSGYEVMGIENRVGN